MHKSDPILNFYHNILSALVFKTDEIIIMGDVNINLDVENDSHCNCISVTVSIQLASLNMHKN